MDLFKSLLVWNVRQNGHIFVKLEQFSPLYIIRECIWWICDGCCRWWTCVGAYVKSLRTTTLWLSSVFKRLRTVPECHLDQALLYVLLQQCSSGIAACLIYLPFSPRCMECRRGLAILSVRLSVKRVDCDKTEERPVQIFLPYKRSFSLAFWEEEWLVGRPLLPEILGQRAPVGAKSLISNRYSLVEPHTYIHTNKFI